MSKKSFEKMLERKRESPIDSEDLIKYDESQKKFHSAENKKLNDIKIKEISNFMARIDEKYEDKIFIEKDKLLGDNLNFEFRKQKAMEIIDNIKRTKTKLAPIKESLKFDNTNKISIYELLKYYHQNKDQRNFNKAIKEYKYCITREINIVENDKNISVDLNKFFNIKEMMEKLEELPNHKKNETNINDLRNSLVDIFTSYYYIAKGINDINDILSDGELKAILSVKYTIPLSNNYRYVLDYQKEKKKEIFEDHTEISEEKANEILEKIEYFLCRYFSNFEFNCFQHNQPIDYNNNLSLFYNYIMYSIYELALRIDEKGKKIILKREKLEYYYSQKDFHDLIFDNFFDKEVPFNETMNLLLQFLLLIISCEKKMHSLNEFVYFVHFEGIEGIEKNNDESFIENFVNELNKKYNFFKAKICGKKIILDKNNKSQYDKIEINLENYSKKILNLPIDNGHKNIHILWENILFEKFQKINFFIEKDIKYLKYLLKHILSSNLYKKIFENFNNVTPVADYYFNNINNIDDYIKRIRFLPFRVGDLGKFAITDRHSLSILVCGFPEKEIRNLKEYRIFRILELALRIIILSGHEPPHFIKAAYNMLSGGIISRNTSNNDKTIEGGYFLEEVLFGWKKNEDTTLDLKELKLKENEINYRNKNLKNKKIDLITAIQLLNPDIYDGDLKTFRKAVFEISIEDLKNFNISSIKNKELKEYLESVIDEKIIDNLSDDDFFTVNASMGFKDDFCVSYIQFNHNLYRFE